MTRKEWWRSGEAERLHWTAIFDQAAAEIEAAEAGRPFSLWSAPSPASNFVDAASDAPTLAHHHDSPRLP